MASDNLAFPWARALPADQLATFIDELWAAAGGDNGMATLGAIEQVIATYRPTQPRRPITDREAEILTLLAQGLTYDQIAHTLTVSVNTVRTSCGTIFSKIGARGGTHAVGVATHYGWITPAALPAPPTPVAARGSSSWLKLYAEVADQLRRDPCGFVDVGPYSQRNSAQLASRRINKGLLAVFAPAGTFHARPIRADGTRWVLRIRYVGSNTTTEDTR